MKKNKSKDSNIINWVDNHKKIIIISGIIVVVLIIVVILVTNYFKDNSISIEIGKNNINYIYAPGNETIAKMNLNDSATLKILVNKNKQNLVKCYSTNENIVSFVDKTTFKAQALGETEIYCELLNNKSNNIKVKVGN